MQLQILDDRRFKAMKISEKSARNWISKLRILRKQYGSEGDVLFLTQRKKRGRPSTLPDECKKHIKSLVTAARDSGSAINPCIVGSVAKSVVKSHGKEVILKENGGDLNISEKWAFRFIRDTMGWVKRKETTTRKLSDDEKHEAGLEARALMDCISKYNPDLVLMMDETMAPWKPQVNHTYTDKGASRVVIQGSHDFRGNTATFTITRSNVMLPPQFIWAGLTTVCIPKSNFGCRIRWDWPQGTLNCFSGPTGIYNIYMILI